MTRRRGALGIVLRRVAVMTSALVVASVVGVPSAGAVDLGPPPSSTTTTQPTTTSGTTPPATSASTTTTSTTAASPTTTLPITTTTGTTTTLPITTTTGTTPPATSASTTTTSTTTTTGSSSTTQPITTTSATEPTTSTAAPTTSTTVVVTGLTVPDTDVATVLTGPDPCVLGCEVAPGLTYAQWHLTALAAPNPAAQLARTVTVAVVDAGIQADHPELEAVTAAPCAPGAGSVVDVEHGTNIAGLLVARSGDATGLGAPVRGLRLLDVSVAGGELAATTADRLATAIRCAVDEGADVINVSMAGSCVGTEALAAALLAAEQAGVVVVAASGNADLSSLPCPAAFETVVSVGGVRQDGTLLPGAALADVVAPGVDLLTTGTRPGRARTLVSGSSFAAPLVAGLVAAVVAERPEWSPGRVRARIAAAAGAGRLTLAGVLADDLASAIGVTAAGRLVVAGDAAIEGVAPTSVAVDIDTGQCTGIVVAAADGGVFTFDGASFHGSLGGVVLAAPVIALARTTTGGGYWLFAADGGVFTFGDASFHGSLGAVLLDAPIVDAAITHSGRGYWLLGADGEVYAFGDAEHVGSFTDPDEAMVALVPMSDGYAVVHRTGRVVAFGPRFRGWAAPDSTLVVDAFALDDEPQLVTGGDVVGVGGGSRLMWSSAVVAAAPAGNAVQCSARA